MTKILIILGVVFAFFMLVLGLGIRLVKGLLKPFTPHVEQPRKNTNGEILYNKDDIIVMKGDAGKSRQK